MIMINMLQRLPTGFFFSKNSFRSPDLYTGDGSKDGWRVASSGGVGSLGDHYVHDSYGCIISPRRNQLFALRGVLILMTTVRSAWTRVAVSASTSVFWLSRIPTGGIFSPSSTGQIFTYSVFDEGYVDTDAVGKGWFVTDSCGIKVIFDSKIF